MAVIDDLHKRRRLLTALSITFTDDSLLEQALTHRSASSRNYERLEFLGDGLINCIAAELLFERFPQAPEGELSRMRANVVQESALAEVARSLDLGPHLVLGTGEMKSGGFRRESILADVVESILGAVYLDQGWRAARELGRRMLESALKFAGNMAQQKDAKTVLQERLQSKQIALPAYEIVDSSGEDHAKTFVAACTIPALGIVTKGQGASRRAAEQEAARLALNSLENV
jgi:ribonuclease III